MTDPPTIARSRLTNSKLDKGDEISSIINSYLALDKKNQNEKKTKEFENNNKSLNSRNKEIKLKVSLTITSKLLICAFSLWYFDGSSNIDDLEMKFRVFRK